MGKEPSPDIESNPQQRRGDGVVAHPVAIEPAIHRTPPPSRKLLPFRHCPPWLVPSFFAVNVAVFVVAMYVNDCPKNSASCLFRSLGRFAFQPLRENPLLGPSTSTLDKMGALVVTEIVNGHQGWRLITCIWLHAGVFHIVANMFSLLFIGIRLEQQFGFVRIGMLYVISGFGGSLMSALFIQSSTSVGASGALFGLLGGMLSELITNWTIYSNKLAALLTLVFTIAINLAVGILPHVDNFAHIGGFTSGFLLGFVFLIRPQFRWVNQKIAPLGYHAGRVNKHKLYQCVLWVIAALFLIVGFGVSLILLFRGFNATNHCSWCRYLTCIPSSAWTCTPARFYCTASRAGSQLNLTCDGKMQSYLLADVTESQIQELCAQLCS